MLINRNLVHFCRAYIDIFTLMANGYDQYKQYIIIIKVDCHTGAIGMRLLHDNESSQVQDAVKLVATALDRLVAAGESLSPPTASCRETTQWDSGPILFKWVS